MRRSASPSTSARWRRRRGTSLRHRRRPRPGQRRPDGRAGAGPVGRPPRTCSPTRGAFAGHRPLAVVGRDPRASGEMLEAAVVAGLTSAGVDVLDVGRAADPGGRHPHRRRSAPTSASCSPRRHNPMPDNGIKFFARGGHKLADEVEDAIEARLGEPWDRPTGAGRRPRPDVPATARDALRRRTCSRPLPHSARRADRRRRLRARRRLTGRAGGAAPGRRRGRRPIGAEPDGLNINDGVGSTHLERLRAAVRRARRRRRHRPRRRRRPLPGGRRRRRGRRRRPDPRRARARAARGRHAARGHRRRAR